MTTQTYCMVLKFLFNSSNTAPWSFNCVGNLGAVVFAFLVNYHSASILHAISKPISLGNFHQSLETKHCFKNILQVREGFLILGYVYLIEFIEWSNIFMDKKNFFQIFINFPSTSCRTGNISIQKLLCDPSMMLNLSKHMDLTLGELRNF